jgi:hypothetical protein
MAQNLNESAVYETDIPSIETTDDVVGSVPAGDPNGGVANGPHVKMTNRTKYLKAQTDAHDASISALQGVVVALDAGKANKANETHTGEHTFASSLVRNFVPVPSSQARKIKSWEFAFGLEDVGNGIAALTSKNLIEALVGVERLLYNENFAIGIDGILIYHNTDEGVGVGYRQCEFGKMILPLSQDPTKPYSLMRLSINLPVTEVKSRTFWYPTSAASGAKYLSGGVKLEDLETALDGAGSNERAPIIGVFSDFAGGQNEALVFIRNGHSTGKLDYLQGWITIRALPNLIATVS